MNGMGCAIWKQKSVGLENGNLYRGLPSPVSLKIAVVILHCALHLHLKDFGIFIFRKPQIFINPVWGNNKRTTSLTYGPNICSHIDW